MTDSSLSCKPSSPTDAAFDALVNAAQACRACPAMHGRTRVLSRANGSVQAGIMLVGEAPGRLGAERTGMPFEGDESGRRLARLLDAAGWLRADIFITNAVLCNPQRAGGTNRPPRIAEIRNCSTWLEQQLLFVNPILVVALGSVALRALALIVEHQLTVQNAGDRPIPWHDRYLAAVYHPGARAAIHRPVSEQRSDFERLGNWFADLP